MPRTLHSDAAPLPTRPFLAPTLFGALGAGAQAKLRERATRRRFADGQLVQQRGEDGTGFWVIERGEVRLGQFAPGGSFDAFSQLGPGDSFGEVALLSGRTRIADAFAVGEAELLWIRADRFEAALAADPASMRSLLGTLSIELQEFVDLVGVLQRGQAGMRVAHMLANLARGREVPARIAMSQQDLAELVGATRMSVSSALARLEEEGVVRRGYRVIEVIDPQRLVELAER